MPDIAQLSDEDLKAAAGAQSSQPDISQLSDDDLKKAAGSKTGPIEGFIRGVGRAATTFADLPRAVPPPYIGTPYSGYQAGPTGNLIQLGAPGSVTPPATPIPTLTQQYNKAFGAPTPFQWTNPSTYPETLGGAGGALVVPAMGKMAEGMTGLSGLAANYAIPGAVTNMGFQTAERSAQGQPTTPGNLAVDAATGGVMNTVFGPPLEKGLSLVGQAIQNKFAPKKINLDEPAPPATTQSQPTAATPATTTEPPAAPTQPEQVNLGDTPPTPLKGTVREKAVQLRKRPNTLNEKLSSVIDSKLRLDQIEYNFQQSFKLLAERIKNRDKVNILKRKPIVVDPVKRRLAREAATKEAGLAKNQVRATDKNYIDTIRLPGTSLQPWNPSKKIMSDKQLVGEVEKWMLLHKKAHADYKDAKTIANLEKDLQPGSPGIEVPYKGHRYLVKYVRNKTEYRPHGTPEQNRAYDAAYGKLMAVLIAKQKQINKEFEADIDKLVNYLSVTEPGMARAIKGIQALKTKEVLHTIEQAGLTDTYTKVLQGMISSDNNVIKALSIASIVAGQAVGGPAKAATDEKEQERNVVNVGTALTLLGLIGLVGPKALNSQAAKEFRSQTAHFLFYVSDKYYLPALRAAESAAAKMGLKVTAPEIANSVNRLMGAVTLTRSNLDIIERNADPTFLAAFRQAKNEYRKATGGKELMPLNATVEQSQALVKGMYAGSVSEIEHLPLSNEQKRILRNMFFAKQRVADICRKEEARLTRSTKKNPSKVNTGVYGNQGLAATIALERKMNWEPGSAYARNVVDDIGNLIAHGATQAAQLGGWPLHIMHLAEKKGSVGARWLVEDTTADVLIARRDKNALAFCRANNITMPLTGTVEETETSVTKKISMWPESVLRKVLGDEKYNQILNIKPAQTIRRMGSGKGFESIKTDTALVAGSEVAAHVLDYPGGGAALRADFTHWMNNEPEKCSSHFTPEKGFATMGIIYDDVLDKCIGADAIGIRVNLTIDRWAQATGFGIVRSVATFAKTAIIANRARNLLSQAAIDGLASGDLKKAAAAAGAFAMTYAISSMWQGSSAIEKEYEQYLLDNHPLEAVKLHKAMAQLNVVGQTPGAVGYVLNKLGYRNEFEKNNFVLSHTQPTVFWPTRLSSPQPLEASKAVIELGDPKISQRTKNRDLVFLAGIMGCGSFADTISLSHAYRMFTAFRDAQDRGGHVDFAYTPRWSLNADAQIPEGHEAWGREKSHYLGQRLEQQPSPIAAAAVSFFRPGDSLLKDEYIFNMQAEYACQRLLKREFPQNTLDYFTAVLEHNRPVHQYYEHIYKKISLHTATPQEEAMFKDTRTMLVAEETEDNSPIVPLYPGVMVKPNEFWQKAYQSCKEKPNTAKWLNPELAVPGWAKKHHRHY